MTTYLKNTSGHVFTTDHPEYHKESEQLTKKDGEKLYREQCRKELLKLLKPGSTIHTILCHVSKSGMQREIKLVVCSKDGIRNISYLASVVMKDRIGKRDGIIIGGCGMDMGFALVHNLGYYLWPNGTKKPHGTRNGQPDNDGGYALKQSWL
jgi:hypothetical protein